MNTPLARCFIADDDPSFGRSFKHIVDGLDSTNELSYLLLESTQPLRASYPELAAPTHAHTPDVFLHAVVKTVKDGEGSPRLLGDEFQFPFFLSHGIPKREAVHGGLLTAFGENIRTKARKRPADAKAAHEARMKETNLGAMTGASTMAEDQERTQ